MYMLSSSNSVCMGRWTIILLLLASCLAMSEFDVCFGRERFSLIRAI